MRNENDTFVLFYAADEDSEIPMNFPRDQLKLLKEFGTGGIIAQILQINSAALLLSCVDDGCVQLIFLIPKFVAKEVFPLSCEQTSALAKDASVIRLECEQFIFEVSTKLCR